MSSATLVSTGNSVGPVGAAQAVSETTKTHSSGRHSHGCHCGGRRAPSQCRRCRLGPGNTNIHLIQLAIKGVGKQALVTQAVVVGHFLCLFSGQDFFLHR